MEHNRMSESVFIIGGDERQVQLFKILKRAKHETFIYGLEGHVLSKTEKLCIDSTEFLDKLTESKYVFLPIPSFDNDGYIKMKFSVEKINFAELIKHLSKNTIVIGGNIPKNIITLFQKAEIQYMDLLIMDEFLILNAIPTVEGAIQVAMIKTIHTINESKVLVLGYGRIGKMLAKKLYHLGAEVSVAARKPSDLAFIREGKYKPIHIDNLDTVLMDNDIIFNTIPSVILDENRLKKLKFTTLIIDLASGTGGLDYCVAGKLNINAQFCPGLPGKVAPATAAEYIHQMVKDIIKN